MRWVIQKILRSIGYELVVITEPEWARARVILRAVFQKLAINCVLDVGANVGQYATALRQFGYAGWIISFEPVQRCFDQLRARAACDPKWRVYPWALGSHDGEATINVTQWPVFSSFLQPDPRALARFESVNSVVATERVSMRRLDSVVSTCLEGIVAPSLYLKLDTQGFDLSVIEGATAVLSRIKGLQTEVAFRKIYLQMDDVTQSLHALAAKGFEVVDFNPVTRELDGLRVIEMDCFMVRSLSEGIG